MSTTLTLHLAVAVAGLITLAIGLLFARRWWRLWRVRTVGPVCATCLYDLSAGASDEMVCPECGTTTQRDRVRRVGPQRRRRTLIVAVVCVVLGAAGVVGSPYEAWRSGAIYRDGPSGMLTLLADWGNEAAERELWDRLIAGAWTPSPNRTRAMAAPHLATLRQFWRTRGASAFSWGAPEMDATDRLWRLVACDGVNDPAWRQSVYDAIAPLSVWASDRVHSGAALHIEWERSRMPWYRGSLRPIGEVDVSVVGVFDASGNRVAGPPSSRPRRTSSGDHGWASGFKQWAAGPRTPVGRYTLELEVTRTLEGLETQDGRAQRRRGGPSSAPPAASMLAQPVVHRQTVRLPLVVAPRGSDFGIPTSRDDAIREYFESGLRPALVLRSNNARSDARTFFGGIAIEPSRSLLMASSGPGKLFGEPWLKIGDWRRAYGSTHAFGAAFSGFRGGMEALLAPGTSNQPLRSPAELVPVDRLASELLTIAESAGLEPGESTRIDAPPSLAAMTIGFRGKRDPSDAEKLAPWYVGDLEFDVLEVRLTGRDAALYRFTNETPSDRSVWRLTRERTRIDHE